jgi:mitogen-activated protein kinase kinase kinase 9
MSQHLHNEVVIDMKMGELFTLLLTSRGEMYTMGENIDGQLGLEGVAFTEVPQRLSGLPLIA